MNTDKEQGRQMGESFSEFVSGVLSSIPTWVKVAAGIFFISFVAGTGAVAYAIIRAVAQMGG